MNEEQLIAKLLKVLEENILPLTKIEVKRGNKIFGAAILKKSDLNLVEELCLSIHKNYKLKKILQNLIQIFLLSDLKRVNIFLCKASIKNQTKQYL